MIELVHDGEHLVVARKPSGVATTSPSGEDSLTRRLEAQLAAKLHPTSRLDAEVTGLVTYARTKVAIAALKEARARGEYRREYLALASAEPDPEEGDWRWSIAIDPKDRRLRVAVEPGGTGQRLQEAHSRYAVLAVTPAAVALRLWPQTGRTHQLRVHAARAGAPLLGDARYGGPRRVALADGRVVRAARVMLHCRRLSIPDAAGGRLDLEDPPPEDLAELWARLGGEPL